MTIGIDARLWYGSGVGRYIRNLVFGLEKINQPHEFVIFLNSDAYDNVHFSNKAFKKVRCDVKWHTVSEQWKLKKVIDGENLDLMHFTYFSYPVLYNKPFVITIHDLIIDHYPTGKASSLPLPLYHAKRLAYKHITKKAVKNSLKIIAPSVATKDELVSHYNADEKKIHVIYEGFEKLVSGKKKTELVSKNYILYVGNAYPHKNLKNLILAFRKLREVRDVELVLIGRKDFFYDRIEATEYEGIHFLHDIDDNALFDYYTNAHLTVTPALMEGFGLPVLEAMSLSCPVVSSNANALKEIGGDAAFYFEPKNITEIRDSILKVLSSDALRASLIKKGIERCQQFTWKKSTEETLKLYESCDSLRQG